jgi:hypothetical protein
MRGYRVWIAFDATVWPDPFMSIEDVEIAQTAYWVYPDLSQATRQKQRLTRRIAGLIQEHNLAPNASKIEIEEFQL